MGTRGRVEQQAEQFAIVATLGSSRVAIVLVEQPAQVRETKWHLGGLHADRVLSLPAMLFGARFMQGTFETFYAYFLKGPYEGLTTPLYQTIMPNSSANGWVCMGNEPTRDALMRRTAALSTWGEKMAVLLTHYWQDSHFSDHVIERLTTNGPRLHPCLESLATWETASRRQPNFIHTVDWEPAWTAGQLVRMLLGRSQ